ncbi:MAG: hypothetical protein MJ085_00945 [Clostridia bacterium]|nr:hypothetical protein [Clostridia bacterium]
MIHKRDLSASLLLGFTHFLIDLTCHALLTYAMYHYADISLLWSVVLYNGLAFAFQLPIGAISDLLGSSRGFSALGCVLVALACLLPSSLAICLVAGIGNALFHVGGGRESLLLSGTRYTQIGLFVAPGALGVFFGPKIIGIIWLYRLALPGILFLLAAVFSLTANRCVSFTNDKPLPLSRGKKLVILLCMFLTVFLRAYMGTVTHYAVSGRFPFALVMALCVFLGKLSGGIMADRFGAFRFTLIAQTLGLALYLGSLLCPYLALPAALVFNTTMALTAFTLFRLLPQLAGAMFGVTTVALFLGSLPKMLRLETPFFNWWGLLLIGVMSTSLLLLGLHLAEGGTRYD